MDVKGYIFNHMWNNVTCERKVMVKDITGINVRR